MYRSVDRVIDEYRLRRKLYREILKGAVISFMIFDLAMTLVTSLYLFGGH
jgi:hypothetical protein